MLSEPDPESNRRTQSCVPKLETPTLTPSHFVNFHVPSSSSSGSSSSAASSSSSTCPSEPSKLNPRHPYSSLIPSLFRPYSGLIPSCYCSLFRPYSGLIPPLAAKAPTPALIPPACLLFNPCSALTIYGIFILPRHCAICHLEQRNSGGGQNGPVLYHVPEAGVHAEPCFVFHLSIWAS